MCFSLALFLFCFCVEAGLQPGLLFLSHVQTFQRSFPPLLLALCAGLALASFTHGQTLTSANNGESKPIPGAGHDYIHLLSETVSPANGSVDVPIRLPAPTSRALTIPFSIA